MLLPSTDKLIGAFQTVCLLQLNDRMQLQQAGCAAVFEPEGSLYHQGECYSMLLALLETFQPMCPGAYLCC
jgi:hypothetical protein